MRRLFWQHNQPLPIILQHTATGKGSWYAYEAVPFLRAGDSRPLERGNGEAMKLGTLQTPHRKFWQWLKDQIDEVPEGDELCEYDCRNSCTQQEWATCERRIEDSARRTSAQSQLCARSKLWSRKQPANPRKKGR